MIHKTLEEHLSEQRELYKQYTAPAEIELTKEEEDNNRGV